MDSPASLADADPKNLIRESFRIEGIGEAECRSIFLDWALSLPVGVDAMAAIRLLLDHYAPKAAQGAGMHPMIAVLVAGAQAQAGTPRRRGGRAGRAGG